MPEGNRCARCAVKCGGDNRQGRKFCAECGAPLAARCSRCGASNETGERFCGECGAPLAESAPSAPPRPSRASVPLNAAIAGETADGERKTGKRRRLGLGPHIRMQYYTYTIRGRFVSVQAVGGGFRAPLVGGAFQPVAATAWKGCPMGCADLQPISRYGRSRRGREY